MRNKHICKNPSCKKVFDYCRACVFKPIFIHEAGYCSAKCFVADRTTEQDKPTLPVEEIAEVVEQSEEIIEAVEPEDGISTIEENIEEEYTSSFNTEECVSVEDIETAQEE